MLLYSVLCLFVLVTNYGDAFPSSTQDELYENIGNKHMLVDKDAITLINGQKPVLYEGNEKCKNMVQKQSENKTKGVNGIALFHHSVAVRRNKN